jgi:uncharacterized repeat protein (TIGR03803 family)
MFAWLMAIGALGQVKLTTLHTLSGTDGEFPIGGVAFDSKGNLYGTTRYGGSSNPGCPFLDSCGTVFQLSPDGVGGWTFQTVYDFSGGADGAQPDGDLIVDNLGNIYGTTYSGGIVNSICPKGCGTVFRLSPSPSVGWSLTTLHSFTGADGANPYSGVIRDSAGRLYGTTNFISTVFVLVPAKSGWTFSTLYAFGYRAGYAPYGGLTIDASGNLYGTNSLGGISGCNNGYGCGTVFELSRSGGVGKLTILHEFRSCTYNDGAQPMGSLVIDSAGDVFGATEAGGTGCGNGSIGKGTIFKLSRAAGEWREQVLHRFNGTDGQSPTGDLAMDSSGVVYGATQYGGTGSGQEGTVFMLKRRGTVWDLTTLYNFSDLSGGGQPIGGVSLGAGGLFGTTMDSQPLATYGEVFELSQQ